MTENEAVTPRALGDDADGAVRSSPAHLHQGERVQTEETGAVTLYTRVTESGGRMRWSFRVQPNMAAAGRVFVFTQPGFRLIYRPSNPTSGAQGTPSAIEARDGQQTAQSRDNQQTAESRDCQQTAQSRDDQQDQPQQRRHQRRQGGSPADVLKRRRRSYRKRHLGANDSKADNSACKLAKMAEQTDEQTRN